MPGADSSDDMEEWLSSHVYMNGHHRRARKISWIYAIHLLFSINVYTQMPPEIQYNTIT